MNQLKCFGYRDCFLLLFIILLFSFNRTTIKHATMLVKAVTHECFEGMAVAYHK